MLRDTHMKAFISPLHDRDVDENGEIKKAHYHIVVVADGPISKSRADKIIEPFGGTKSAEYIMSLTGYVRYLAHMDSPEKAQYDPTEIIALNGADLASVLKPSQSDKYKTIGEIMRFCAENQIYEFSALSRYAMQEQKEWFAVLTEKPYLIVQYLASLRHSHTNTETRPKRRWRDG
jgi:hypothetical protein